VPEAEAARIRIETIDPHDTHRPHTGTTANLGLPPGGADYIAIGPSD
jgi:hypothetical protein